MAGTPSAAAAGAITPDAASQRHSAAEQAVWRHHGLRVTERDVQLEFPRIRLRVTVVGSGPPVLLLGGLGGSAPHWAGLVAELPQLRCLVLDRPGCGLSTPIDYRSHDHAVVATEIVAGVLDRLGVRRCAVVGHGLGNLWALRFALRDPARVGRLVLLGGGPVVAGLRPPLPLRLLTIPVVGAALVRTPVGRRMLTAGLGLSGPERAQEAEEAADVRRGWHTSLMRDTPTARHERSMLRSVVGPGGLRSGVVLEERELRHLSAPTLVVLGGPDRVGSIDRWRHIVDLLPRGELELVPAAGVTPWREEPGTLGRLVRGFLAQMS